MFDVLQTKLGGVFEKLKGRGSLNEADVETAMGEIRTALLEADVALPVVKTFIADVKERAVGEDLIKSVSPGQQVVKSFTILWFQCSTVTGKTKTLI